MARFASAALAFLFLFCLAPAPASAGEPIRFGILPVLDTLPLQVAVADGLFTEQGLDVELVPFQSALELDTAVTSGRLDGYFGDLLKTLLLIQSGAGQKVVSVNYSPVPGQMMFALVAGPGKAGATSYEVGISRSTVIEYLMDRMLQQTDSLRDVAFNPTEIKKIPIRLQMLLSGQLDAAVLPEPLVTLAVSKGATVLATDEHLGEPLTVVCLAESRLAARKKFLKARAEAVRRINADPEAYRELMGKTIRIPPPLVPTFPVYRFPENTLPTETELFRIQQWMLTRGLLRTMLGRSEIVAD